MDSSFHKGLLCHMRCCSTAFCSQDCQNWGQINPRRPCRCDVTHVRVTSDSFAVSSVFAAFSGGVPPGSHFLCLGSGSSPSPCKGPSWVHSTLLTRPGSFHHVRSCFLHAGLEPLRVMREGWNRLLPNSCESWHLTSSCDSWWHLWW